MRDLRGYGKHGPLGKGRGRGLGTRSCLTSVMVSPTSPPHVTLAHVTLSQVSRGVRCFLCRRDFSQCVQMLPVSVCGWMSHGMEEEEEEAPAR